METSALFKAIGSVNSIWSMAAFTIAAILGLLSLYLRTSAPARAGKAHDSKASQVISRLLWAAMGLVCVIGLAPIAANGLLENQRMKTLSIYRVRVTVVDEQNVPITGAHLRATASSESAVTSNGDGSLTIARGSMPANGRITVFADKDAAFLHGSADIQLAGDPNPSILLRVKGDASAGVSGMVEDNAGHAIAGAVVSLAAGSSTRTSETGSFALNAHAGAGQPVTLHVEKAGYEPVDQSHLAGNDPAIVVLHREVVPR